MKTKETMLIEEALHLHVTSGKLGVYGVPEVSMDGDTWKKPLDGKKWGIVDYITINTSTVIHCYEIKVTLADFLSDSRLTFIGHYNYFVVPEELLPIIAHLVPHDIGIYMAYERDAYNYYANKDEVRYFLECYKKPKKRVPLCSTEHVKGAMLRAACRCVKQVYEYSRKERMTNA